MTGRREVTAALLLTMLLGGSGCVSPASRPAISSARPPEPSPLGTNLAIQTPPTVPPVAAPTAPPPIPAIQQMRFDATQSSPATPEVPRGSASTTPGAAAAGLTPLRSLHRLAAERYAGIDGYIARMRRREQVNGRDKPEEILLFKFRKQPRSVYFKWLGTEGAGREVVFVQGQYGNMIHTLLAAGDMPFSPAGKHLAISPDNPFVRTASRHSITEAGVGTLIEHFGKLVESQERGDVRSGTLRPLGTQRRPEFDTPLDAVEHTIPAGFDPHLPRGGRRLWLFDPASHLPVLITTWDHTGHEVEYYCYDRLQYPVPLDDADFNPDKLWPTSR